MGSITVRQAVPGDVPTITSILREAAQWLNGLGMPLWLDAELREEDIAIHVRDGLYHIATHEGEAAGVLRFQLSDPEVWPDVAAGESGFVHRLAVRRRYAGGTVSSAMLSWAEDESRCRRLKYLRLDCDAARPRLRAIYEAFGFRHHSNFQAGPFFVARFERRLDA